MRLLWKCLNSMVLFPDVLFAEKLLPGHKMTLTGEDTDLEYKMEASHSDDDETEMQVYFTNDERSRRQPVVDHMSSERMAQLLAIYQKKVHDSKRVIVRLKQQKDAQLQSVISQLLVLEGQLRREQKGIIGQLVQRDHVIAAQRQEIDRLRRDNRRLINKLKKFSEMCEKAGKLDQIEREPRIKMSRINSSENNSSPNKTHNTSVLNSPMSRKASSGMIRVATSISELISSNNDGSLLKSHETHNHSMIIRNSNHQSMEYVNPNVASVRATTNRIFHKPPIAEKPKVVNRVVQMHHGNKNCQQVLVGAGEKECSIVSTISRLLEEESDATNTGSSGSSEPSSPEATLKPITPRVIRLARQFEEGLNNHNVNLLAYQNAANSSPELLRSDEQTSKSYIMDEYEVTSGYNSDSISDHEYENIRVGSQDNNSPSKYSKTDRKDDENEEDNYVILRAVREEHNYGNWIDIPEDQHIYSNVEFGSGLLVKNIDSDDGDGDTTIQSYEENPRDSPKSTPQKRDGAGVMETNLDASPSGDHLMSESMRVAANVPRSRHNINLIMERDGDHMTENFEEFTLDSLELEEDQGSEDDLHGQGKENLPVSEQRRCGDGAEAKMNIKNNEDTSAAQTDGKESTNVPTNGQYEKFLEATGLSQKSILTPTRMFSNHRSMLKPRDIKHRDKLRTTFTSHSTAEDPQNSSGSYKYWTEPYL